MAAGKIADTLSGFEIITLEEMDGVKLLDRTDTKFIYHREQLPLILQELQNDYRVLDINGVKFNRYETLYFDTPDLRMYRIHQSGKLNRFKVRFRKYVDSNLHYFEIKFKNNKKRTIKSRVKQKEISYSITDKSELLLRAKTTFDPERLRPAIWVNYTRIALVNKRTPERLTIDIDLTYKKDDLSRELHNLVIMEVKQERAGSSPVINVLKKRLIRECSISKYCFGIIHLYDAVVKNNFKEKLLTLNKVLYGAPAGT